MGKDKILQSYLLKKETPEPPDYLDDQIMTKISKIIKQNFLSQSYLFLAWLFFAIGFAIGILISTIFVKRETILFGLNFSEYSLIIQILFSFIILLLFEKIYKITIEIRKRPAV